jgi:phosphatidylglycerophosphate synthase
MVVCPEREEAEQEPAAPPSLALRARKERAHRELLTQKVYARIGRVVVALLIPLRVSPVAVVVANGLAGLAAAAAIVGGDLVPGALLLQVKSILDNADGQLARATGRTSALGRYLDTEVDLLVNVVLFAALAHETGSVALAVAAFVAVTLALSSDFNADVLYRRARGREVVTQPSAAGEGPVAKTLAAVYGVIFAPQDRVLQAISRRRLERVAGHAQQDLPQDVGLAYHDGATASALSNFGLSTQLAVLGICLVAGEPTVYLWLTLTIIAVLPILQVRRELRARRVVAASS